MREERHRDLAIAAYRAYEERNLEIASISLSELASDEVIDQKPWPRVVYVLRLDPQLTVNASVESIANRNDALGVLYIGGHSGGAGGTRYNQLIRSCRRVELHYEKHGFAENDQRHKEIITSVCG